MDTVGGEDLLEFSRSKHVGLVFLRLQYTIWESEYQRIVLRYFPFIGKFGLKNQWVIERIYRMSKNKIDMILKLNALYDGSGAQNSPNVIELYFTSTINSR